MPKEVYEDKDSFLEHWYLFHTWKEPYKGMVPVGNDWCLWEKGTMWCIWDQT